MEQVASGDGPLRISCPCYNPVMLLASCFQGGKKAPLATYSHHHGILPPGESKNTEPSCQVRNILKLGAQIDPSLMLFCQMVG